MVQPAIVVTESVITYASSSPVPVSGRHPRPSTPAPSGWSVSNGSSASALAPWSRQAHRSAVPRSGLVPVHPLRPLVPPSLLRNLQHYALTQAPGIGITISLAPGHAHASTEPNPEPCGRLSLVTPSRSVIGRRRAGEHPVETGKTREIAAQRRPVPSRLNRPPANSFVDLVDAVNLPRPPPKHIPKKRVGAFACMPGVQMTLDPKPVIIVKVLLLRIGKSHEQPVLDLLTFRQQPAGRVQTLEYLLRILLIASLLRYLQKSWPARAIHPPPLCRRRAMSPAATLTFWFGTVTLPPRCLRSTGCTTTDPRRPAT